MKEAENSSLKSKSDNTFPCGLPASPPPSQTCSDSTSLLHSMPASRLPSGFFVCSSRELLWLILFHCVCTHGPQNAMSLSYIL